MRIRHVMPDAIARRGGAAVALARFAVVALVAAAIGAGCGHAGSAARAGQGPPPPSGAVAAAAPAVGEGGGTEPGAGGAAPTSPAETTASRTEVDPRRVHALLVNGGGEKASNYQSHLVHLRSMVDALERAGVPASNVTVLASDGEDPAPDLAVRAAESDGDGWLLEETRLANRVGRPIAYVSSELDGAKLRPATRAGLEKWFASDGRALEPGDVLLLYVTDHGTRGKEGPRSNRISLWGKGDSITVGELEGLLAKLGPGVRVVAVMSQCFSGGFAHLASAGPGGEEGRVCGYFSSTEDRQAYGCYPENRGALNVGHAVRFIEALDATGDLAASHERVLVLDRTPDVPLRTSDVRKRAMLDRAAAREGRSTQALADDLLREAWRDPARREHDLRLLDRIGQSFGLGAPRSVAEVDERLAELPKVSEPLGKYSAAWQESLGALAEANLERFLEANPSWRERTSPAATRNLDPAEAGSLGEQLVAELGPFTRADAGTAGRLQALREKAGAAEGASYRMQVREAALLRQKLVLLDVAADVWLDTRATPAERAEIEALRACEQIALRPGAGEEDPTTIDLAVEPDLPAYADDVRVAEESAPAWMGIGFDQPGPERRERERLPIGAVEVRQVFPGSPAEKAGLEVGDVIVGPPGAHFTEPQQVREWTMLRRVGEPVRLDVIRDGGTSVRTLVPGTHPGKFPALPGPPRVGSAAPPLQLEAYRGVVPGGLATGKPHLLFFWATWCLPCKAALPELLAFSAQRNVEVVAISDEERGTLDSFFAGSSKEFPHTVARDPKRRAFRDYGVSGTPTFVLVDGAGVVQSVSTGYTPKKGLGIPGWTWSRTGS